MKIRKKVYLHGILTIYKKFKNTTMNTNENIESISL